MMILRKVNHMGVSQKRLKEISKEVARHNETYNYPTTPKKKKTKKLADE